MATVIPFEEIQLSPTAALFQGGDDFDASIFVVHYERGVSVPLHTHPYPEVFVVLDGTAKFILGDEELIVESGHMTMAPPETPHGFEGVSDETLRVVSVHPQGKVEQTWL